MLNGKNGGIKGLAIVFLMLWIIAIIFTVTQAYEIDRDIESWLNRAQVSSNPTDMLDYLEKCRDGMIKSDLTTGHGHIFWHTPDNDMTLIMKALDRSIERCKDIEQMDKDSPEYQTALDDVRGQIRELDLYAWQKWVADNVPIFLWVVTGWLTQGLWFLAKY